MIKFSDLKVGAKFDVGWKGKWTNATVAFVELHTRINGMRVMRATLRFRHECGNCYFFEDTFARAFERGRIRLPEAISPIESLIAATGTTAAEREAFRSSIDRRMIRAAAKLSFPAVPQPPEVVDGLDRGVIYNRFQLAQREDAAVLSLPPLTPAQKEVARTMWAAELELESARADKARRERELSVYVEIDPED
jgi:hypothetical protein